MLQLSKLDWVTRLVLSSKEKDALLKKVLPMIRAMRIEAATDNFESKESPKDPVDVARDSIRKFVKVYLYVTALGVSVWQVLSVVEKVLQTGKISVPGLQNIRKLALFASLLLSLRPLAKKMLQNGTSTNSKHEIAANLLASTIAVSFYPSSFLLETTSLWYLFFGIEYGYRLFEHRQLRASSEEMESNRSIFQKLHSSLSQKSWLLFSVSSSIFWRNFILEPPRAHGLPTQIFTTVLEKIRLTGARDDLLTILRKNAQAKKALTHLRWRPLLGELPSSYLKGLRVSALMIAFKSLIQHEDLRERLKNLSLYEVVRKYVLETLKLSALIAGVPITSIMLTTFFLQFGPISSRGLSVIGFTSGLIAVLYRGRKRLPEEKDVKIETTNRGAWLTMLRETLIASITGQPGAETISRVAFLAGLAALFSINDLEADCNEDDEVFHDSKVIRYLNRISR